MHITDIRFNALLMAERRLGNDAKMEELFTLADRIAGYVQAVPEPLTPPLIKPAFTPTKYTEEQLKELSACMTTPIIFAEKNFVQHPVKGSIPFSLYDFQKNLLQAYAEHRMVVVNHSRQMGISTTTMLYVLWKAMFNANQTIMLCSANLTHAKALVQILKYFYETCPDYLRDGVKYYTSERIEFANGSRIITRAVQEHAGRGMTINLLVIDSAAYVSHKTMRDFWMSIIPTLSTGGHCILMSNPNTTAGTFAEVWRDAVAGKNGFYPVKITWQDHPERDAAWAAQHALYIGADNFARDHNGEFIDKTK
jgi:hypothetical protein